MVGEDITHRFLKGARGDINNPLIIPLNQALSDQEIARSRPTGASASRQNNYFQSLHNSFLSPAASQDLPFLRFFLPIERQTYPPAYLPPRHRQSTPSLTGSAKSAKI